MKKSFLTAVLCLGILFVAGSACAEWVNTYYSPSGNLWTSLYYEGGVLKVSNEYWDKIPQTLRYRWIPSYGGVRYEYDENGVWIAALYDDGRSIVVTYYGPGNTGNRCRQTNYAAGGSLTGYYEYYDLPGYKIHYKYNAVGGFRYEYDLNGVYMGYLYDNGNYGTVTYYVPSGNMQTVTHYLADGTVNCIVDYWDTPAKTLHYRWIPSYGGIRCEYDENGVWIAALYDDGRSTVVTYYGPGNTGNRCRQTNYAADGSLLGYYEYYDLPGYKIHYKYNAVGGFRHEHDLNGVYTGYLYDNGNYGVVSYYASSNMQFATHYAPDGTVKMIIEYWDTPAKTMHYRWIPSYGGIRYEYDENGVWIAALYDDGRSTVVTYYGPGNTGNRCRQTNYAAGGSLTGYYEYYDLPGYKIHYKYNAVGGFRYEYDLNGRYVGCLYDNGSYATVTYYTPSGNKQSVSYYNAAGKKTRMNEYWDASPSVMSYYYIYGYDAGGNLTAIRKYDDLNRLVKLTLGTGYYYTYGYQDGILFKEKYFSPAGVWQKTIEYYGDGTTKHFEFLADPDPATPGNVVYCVYDNLGRVIKTKCDDGSYITKTYWGATINVFEEKKFNSSGSWLETIRYYESFESPTGAKHYLWIPDPNTGTPGDAVYYECDLYERPIKTMNDNNTFVYSYYWGSTANRSKDIFFGPGWAWQKTTRYDSNGENGVDETDPSVANEFDDLGRQVLTLLGGGDYMITYYRGSTNNKYKDIFFGAGWVYQKNIQYWQNGNKRYEWIKDPNPGASGDIVYVEYAANGVDWILRRYDDGTEETPLPLGDSLLVLKNGAEFASKMETESKLTVSNKNVNGITFTSEMAGRQENPVSLSK